MAAPAQGLVDAGCRRQAGRQRHQLEPASDLVHRCARSVAESVSRSPSGCPKTRHRALLGTRITSQPSPSSSNSRAPMPHEPDMSAARQTARGRAGRLWRTAGPTRRARPSDQEARCAAPSGGPAPQRGSGLAGFLRLGRARGPVRATAATASDRTIASINGIGSIMERRPPGEPPVIVAPQDESAGAELYCPEPASSDPRINRRSADRGTAADGRDIVCVGIVVDRGCGHRSARRHARSLAGGPPQPLVAGRSRPHIPQAGAAIWSRADD